ncbi:MAG: DEAD/DEAH box helicase [Bacteroidetes bacterium]|nr:DEAD/DEAH box helicase [Bacteroidota bacterium]
MSLPHLKKFIHNHGTEEVIQRGKKIHAFGYVDMVEQDDLMEKMVFRVKDDAYHTFYKVQIQKYKDEKAMSVRCSCAYNIGDICRHEVAGLFQLQTLSEQGVIRNPLMTYNPQHTTIKMKQIELKTIRMLCAPTALADAENFLRTRRAKIIEAKDERVTAEISMDQNTFSVILFKNEERNFDTSCNCTENKHPICTHKAIVFIQLLNGYGAQYFDSIRDPNKEKAILLKRYGYQLSDAWQDKFEFVVKEGRTILKILDPSIKTTEQNTQSVIAAKASPSNSESVIITPKSSHKKPGIVFNANCQQLPFFSVDLLLGELDEETQRHIGKVEKILPSELMKINAGEDTQRLIKLLSKLNEESILSFYKRNAPFTEVPDHLQISNSDKTDKDAASLLAEFLLPKLRQLLSLDFPFYVLPKGKKWITQNLVPISVSHSFLTPGFELMQDEDTWIWQPVIKMNGVNHSVSDNEWNHLFIFVCNETISTWNTKEELLSMLEFGALQRQRLSPEALPHFLETVLIPAAGHFPVSYDIRLIKETQTNSDPEKVLYLYESGDYLMLEPAFFYNGLRVHSSEKKEILFAGKNGLIIVHRNIEKEQKFIRQVHSLHSSFVLIDQGKKLAIRGTEALKNNWFFLLMDALNEMKVRVEGWDVLKRFRFNTEKPKTSLFISNGIDWFDAKLNVQFGNQEVPLADVKKAVLNKQNYIQLRDGSLGILPEEWLKKYGVLFRVSEKHQDHLRLSKYHLNLIDVLYEQRDEEEIQLELEAKMDSLRSFKEIEAIDPPENLGSILRPYQTYGFQWLHFLHQAGWGGILADDMGLGKTIQALAFVLWLYEKNPGVKALVVCPTSLIYNWENEIKKFAPVLSYHIHHGGQRGKNLADYSKANVLITTYGTLRSDIKLFAENIFDYVILDESQAIKNPSSKIAKAVCLIQSRHRICLSGTPLQNNTFDLFAQMNFLNPGLLGTLEHFKNYYATPIDKFGEAEQKEELKKIIFPFLLRRTKEQVAKDLPEKTETVLFCEMESEQRAIYEAFRMEFRSKILGTIDEVGIRNSQFTILQGLMKLRQICDAPSLLNSDEVLPNASIKLNELGRELSENIGPNKALVFSQFLGMLSLIQEKLKELNIPFVYFDGSTSATGREKAVHAFQNDPSIRVFLISLKAGGVGLNLTAASYVYIVDPWWNPAVEQQAIDRTHRIGQTNNIFAYRMICKNSIEEKILQLQEKKRALAKDIITDDSGFVKSLSKEDVEFLFS